MITEPNDRYERISSLIDNFHKPPVDPRFPGILHEWNLTVEKNFASVKAK
jgi:hypothetical protein